MGLEIWRNCCKLIYICTFRVPFVGKMTTKTRRSNTTQINKQANKPRKKRKKTNKLGYNQNSYDGVVFQILRQKENNKRLTLIAKKDREVVESAKGSLSLSPFHWIPVVFVIGTSWKRCPMQPFFVGPISVLSPVLYQMSTGTPIDQHI